MLRVRESLRSEHIRARSSEKSLARINRIVSAFSRATGVTVHASNESQLLRDMVQVVAEEYAYPLVWVAILKPEAGQGPIRMGAYFCKHNKCGFTIKNALEQQLLAPLSLESVAPKSSDLFAALNREPWRSIAAKCEHRSVASFPILVQSEPVATLVVHATEENAFPEQDLELISDLAGELGLGIASVRAREQSEAERENRLAIQQELLQLRRLDALGTITDELTADLNDTLTVILLEAEQLSTEIDGEALLRTNAVIRSARRAANLTCQLQTLSRIRVFEPEVISLKEVIAGVTEDVKRLAGKNIEIKTAICDEPLLVKIDKSLFQQAITALGVMVRETIPSGGQLNVEMTSCDLTTECNEVPWFVPAGRYALLTILGKSNAAGAPPHGRLINSYASEKPSAGFGQGLTLVHNIVKHNNGYFVGKGPYFKILLPMMDPLQQTPRKAI